MSRKSSRRIESLHAQGFDRTTNPNYPHCTQCDVLVIQNTACHETGCLNARHECKGCNELVARGVRYCGECA